jgi:hypothetical protein
MRYYLLDGRHKYRRSLEQAMGYVLTDSSIPIVGGLSYSQTNGEMFSKSRGVDFPPMDAFGHERCLQAGMAPHRSPGAHVFQGDLRGLKHGIIGSAGSGVDIAHPQAQLGSP